MKSLCLEKIMTFLVPIKVGIHYPYPSWHLALYIRWRHSLPRSPLLFPPLQLQVLPIRDI